MVSESNMSKRIAKSRGFSLLEIIFILAILGTVLAATANYVRKMIDEKSRQTEADAIAQEVYGTLQFINTDTIKVLVGTKTKFIINPLYQRSDDPVYINPETTDIGVKGILNNPLWQIHPGKSTDANSPDISPYIARTYSRDISSPVSNQTIINDNGNYYSHSLKWSQTEWGKNSVRNYFTDSGCQGAGTGNAVYFNQQFLSCNENPVLRNSEIRISRVDLVNDQGTFSRFANTPSADNKSMSINRVDFYVTFTPVDSNPARIEQFITPLLTAFRSKKVTPNTDGIYLVRRQAGTDNGWTLLDKLTGLPAGPSPTPGHKRTDLATASDLPELVGKLVKGQTYALRFTFDGNGNYLRTDGLNAATKVCWNMDTGVAGPCLTASSPDTLLLAQRQSPNVPANLQVDSVVSSMKYLNADGKEVVEEYYTAPRIQYAAFNNTGKNLGPYYKGGANNDEMCTDTNPPICDRGPNINDVEQVGNGAISIPIQTCPRNSVTTLDKKNISLYPRLSVAVSSVVSGIVKNKIDGVEVRSPDQMVGNIFKMQKNNMKQLMDNSVSINLLGGTVLQVNQVDNTWRISGMVASDDSDFSTDARAWIYFNPSWLSVMITMWCSSVPQS
ncbi:TPA: type II secretion system protein [Salmonella enterica]|nr:type II secretion system protein [Salmonella enterica]